MNFQPNYRDGYEFDGSRLRVEMAKGGRGGAERNRDRRDNRGRTGGRRTEWRVLVTNLPKSTSWQDLKDFMRKAGDVIYANVDEYGDGVVDYGNEDDMEYAIRKLDDVEFKNSHDSSYIRVRADRGRDRRHSSSSDRHRRSRSRDRSDSRDRRRHRDSRDDRKRSPSQNSESEKKRDDPEPKEKKERNGSSRDDSTRRRGSSSGSEREQRRSRRSPSSSSSRER